MIKKKIINTSTIKSENLKSIFIHRVTEILGSEFIKNSVEINEKSEEVTLSGLIGLPTYNYSNSNNQYIFVNDRIISDKKLNTILKVAYRDLMFHDRFPQLILNIKCPFNYVDVNVHPMKSEVRFSDSNFLNSFIINSIKSTLEKVGHKTSTLNSSKFVEKLSEKKQVQNSLILKEKTKKVENLKREEEIENKSEKNDFESHPLGFAKSQFHENYIISETEAGIIITDQHAAHERIIYERIKNDFYNKTIKTQILLIPIIVNVDSIILKNLNDKLDSLQRYGLKIESFGSSSVVVREIPIIISNCDVKRLVESLINEIVDYNDLNTLEAEINKICSTIACHGSIRSGRKLQIDEMNDLLRKMEKTKFSGQCNHGRPTYVELNLNEIEKLFGRK